MTALTNKQRVKVNAALATIHSSGGDASAVTAHAKALERSGHTARAGFEMALNAAIAASPGISAEIGRTIRLIEASDDATVARYDSALTAYNQTGSDAALQALAPMIAQDSVALAIRMGEMTQADIANGGLADALGFAPSDGMLAAALSAPGPVAAPAQSFAFNAANIPASARPANDGNMVNGGPSSPFGARGYSTPKTGAALARQVGIPMTALLPGERPPAPWQGA